MAIKRIKAICCKQNNTTFYIAVISSDILKKMCVVSRKKENREKGFQRLLNPKRAKAIAKYLDESHGIIPSSIIVSAQPTTKISFQSDESLLSFEVVENGFLVIDGQHRLFGLNEATHEYDMPVIIFTDLRSSDEVRLFIDINTTQKGVPAALILDIKNQAGTETKVEERQRILFDRMNENSVLAGLLLPNESKTGKISRNVFYTSTKRVFEDSIISNEDDETVYRVLCNYFEAVDTVFKRTNNKNARLSKSIIFKAVMEMFYDISKTCYSSFRDFKVPSFIEIVQPFEELNFDSYTGTNKAALKTVIDEMKSVLADNIIINEDMF